MFTVPEDLKHEPKIFGAITIKQAVKIGVVGVILSPLLLIDTSLEIRAASFGFLLMMSSMIIVTEKDETIKDILKYASRWNEAGLLDEQMKEFMGIKLEEGIKENMIIRQDGAKLAVLRVEPINIEVKGENEQKAILANYKKFLQSVNYPIHMLVRTVDSLQKTQEYFKKVEENAQEELSSAETREDLEKYFREQREFFIKHIRENAVKDRIFYIVIESRKSELDEAKKQLDNRVESAARSLNKAALPAERLNTSEIISLMASYPEEAVEVDKDYEFPMTILNEQDVERMELDQVVGGANNQ